MATINSTLLKQEKPSTNATLDGITLQLAQI
jgi:hypothetical protein